MSFQSHNKNLSTYVCSFHNKLKNNQCYLNHQVDCRCDDLIEVLLKIENVFYERKRKDIMITPEDASLKREGSDRHNRGRDISDFTVTVSYNYY